MSSLRRALVPILAALLLLIAAGPPSPASAAAPGLTATFSSADNGSWWLAKFVITNPTGAPITGWTLEFDLPAGMTMGNFYHGKATQSGSHVTVVNEHYNGTVPAGGSTEPYSPYFIASGPGTPTGCRVNAQSCDGGSPGEDTTPPSAPGQLRSTGATSTTVSLAWTASADDTGVEAYDVYRGDAFATSATGTSADVSGLSPSTSYTFTVKARDAAGNVSAASNAVTVTTDEGGGPVAEHARVGYFVQWGIYGRQYFVKNLDTSGTAAKLTHLNYAFSNLDPVNLTCLNGVTKATSPNPQDPDQGTGAGDAEADYAKSFAAGQSVDGVGDTWDQPLRGNYNQLKELKAKHPHLKVLISLGGWTYSKFFSDAAATAASRQKLVSSCIDMYIKGNLPAYQGAGGPGSAAGVFDGFDLDWEWPGAEGHPGNHWGPQDKANNTLLFAEFRRQLDELSQSTGKDYLLTAFTPADPAKIAAGWDITTNDGNPSVFDYLDFANFQGYDYHGAGSDNSWEPNQTGHQANQHNDAQDPYPTKFSSDVALQPYLDAGVNPQQLNLGLPFYGRGWQGVADGQAFGEWQSATGAAPGQFPEEAGTRGYANLISSVPNCTVHHDEQSVATYCYTGAGGQWWSFDDPWVIERKTAWIKSKGLLGAMIWEMSGDTPNGTLINAVDAGLNS